MALYSFRCEACGPFDQEVPMQEIGQRVILCPVCANPARRVFTVPFLRSSNPLYNRRPEPTEKALLKAWETGQV